MTMKMTKRDLKNMMKECIVELIKEGAFNGTAVMPSQQQQVPTTLQQFMNPQQVPMHMFQNPGNMMAMQNQQQNDAAALEQVAKYAAANTANLFADPKMKATYQKLFEDTAMHTLPQQSMMTEQYSTMEAQHDVQKLNAIPGVDVSRLAKIAFAGSKKKLPGQRSPDDEDLG